jgi:hypothetical protein
MKGTLTKKINGTWVVRVQSTDQHPSPSVVEHGVEYPLHPEDANLMVFRGQLLNDQHIMDGKEVEFEIVHLSTDPLGRDVKPYAKLINQVPDVRKMVFPKDINGVVVKVGDKIQGIGSLKFQDGFEIDRTPVVTANIQNGKLYFGNLSAESFTLGFKIVESKMVEDDVEKLATEYANNKSSSEVFRDAHKKDFTAGYNKAKETLYTEEDIGKAVMFGRWGDTDKLAYFKFIQSLKQPKQ